MCCDEFMLLREHTLSNHRALACVALPQKVDTTATKSSWQLALPYRLHGAVALTCLLCMPQVSHMAWRADEANMSPVVGKLWRLIGSDVPYRPESATDMLHRLICAQVCSITTVCG